MLPMQLTLSLTVDYQVKVVCDKRDSHQIPASQIASLFALQNSDAPLTDPITFGEALDIIGKFYIISNIFTRSDFDRSFWRKL
jgi:hypothetical protein